MLCRLKWPIARHSKTKCFQNSDTGEKPFNSKKYTHMIITKLWNCKTRVAKKRNRAILREMTFANDCENCCFFVQNWCATKEKFCVSFRKSFANGNPKLNRFNLLRYLVYITQLDSIHRSFTALLQGTQGWQSSERDKNVT